MVELLKGDCLELMKTIPDNSIDAIITDPPYGTTACKWDSVIDFKLMWGQLNRIIKPNGAIVLFGTQPFTSALIMSNTKMFRYEIIWEKDNLKNFFFVKKQIGKVHENICVFYEKQPTYNPQMRKGFNPQNTGGVGLVTTHNLIKKNKSDRQGKTDRYPISVCKFTSLKKAVHQEVFLTKVPVLFFLKVPGKLRSVFLWRYILFR